MKEKKQSEDVKKVTSSQSLPPVDIVDRTQTKGKVNVNFTIVDDSESSEAIEKVDKNKLFSIDLIDYFCPVHFDDSLLVQSLQPLVSSGIMSEDVFNATVSKAKAEFLAAHKDEIEKANNLSIGEVIAKLKENKSLYNKVLSVCGVSELLESRYIDNSGRVQIFRANQCTDKEGNNRYNDVTLRQTENGKTFEQSLFVEYREQTTTNILLAIRYYSTKQDSQKRLLNQIKDYKRILTLVFDAAKRAKETGFSLSQISEQIKLAFA